MTKVEDDFIQVLMYLEASLNTSGDIFLARERRASTAGTLYSRAYLSREHQGDLEHAIQYLSEAYELTKDIPRAGLLAIIRYYLILRCAK